MWIYACATCCREPDWAVGWTQGSSHWWQVTEQEEMASSCARVSLGWISGNTSLQKGLLSTGIGSPGRWLIHHPWMCLKTVWMWCSGMWFSRGLFVRVGWAGHGWTWWPLRSFPTWAILWSYDLQRPLPTFSDSEGFHSRDRALPALNPVHILWNGMRQHCCALRIDLLLLCFVLFLQVDPQNLVFSVCFNAFLHSGQPGSHCCPHSWCRWKMQYTEGRTQP